MYYFHICKVHYWIGVKVLPGGDIVIIIVYSCLIFIQYFRMLFLISWRRVVFCCLTELYVEAWKTITLDGFSIHFDWKTTIGLTELIYCTPIGPSVRYVIASIYSALDPEETCTEATHDWVLVDNLWGMRGGRFVFTNIPLMLFPDDTLKPYHTSTKIKFMWGGKNFVVPYISIQDALEPL